MPETMELKKTRRLGDAKDEDQYSSDAGMPSLSGMDTAGTQFGTSSVSLNRFPVYICVPLRKLKPPR